jgi:hypothetical protein
MEIIRRGVVYRGALSGCAAGARRHKINLFTAFAGQTVGVTEVEDQIWLVSFLDYDLGYFDNERGRVEPGPNPFVPDKLLTMCPEQDVNHVIGMRRHRIPAA